jgi:hypothetical protein
MVESITVGKVTELTLINPVKPGRGPALRQVLSQINPASVRKLETIHFARWVLIDDDKRLLFTSNFDHSLDDYLGDFVRVMPDGMDRIWENCEEYPSEGCRNYPAFAAWVRKYQVATTLWYAAYPAATVKDVLKALDVKAKADQFQREVARPPADTVGQA